jgi:hypothetical protein
MPLTFRNSLPPIVRPTANEPSGEFGKRMATSPLEERIIPFPICGNDPPLLLSYHDGPFTTPPYHRRINNCRASYSPSTLSPVVIYPPPVSRCRSASSHDSLTRMTVTRPVRLLSATHPLISSLTYPHVRLKSDNPTRSSEIIAATSNRILIPTTTYPIPKSHAHLDPQLLETVLDSPPASNQPVSPSSLAATNPPFAIMTCTSRPPSKPVAAAHTSLTYAYPPLHPIPRAPRQSTTPHEAG